jgi:hypothetical protein
MGEGIPEMWAALTTTLAGPFFQEWPLPKALPYTKNLTFFSFVFSLYNSEFFPLLKNM